MTELLSYPEVKRIHIEGFTTIRGKDYLTPEEIETLLGPGQKVVQEKIDGKSNWEMVQRAQVFYEFVKFRHTIPYTHLPSWKIAFDAWDTIHDRWMISPLVWKVLRTRYGWTRALVHIDTEKAITLEEILPLLVSNSAFNPQHQIEGIVIKNYSAEIFAKIVNPKFEEIVDSTTHPMKRRIQERNRLRF